MVVGDSILGLTPQALCSRPLRGLYTEASLFLLGDTHPDLTVGTIASRPTDRLGVEIESTDYADYADAIRHHNSSAEFSGLRVLTNNLPANPFLCNRRNLRMFLWSHLTPSLTGGLVPRIRGRRVTQSPHKIFDKS